MDYVHNPSIPYTGALPQPLQPGSLIRIQGTVQPSATCFAVNLQTGPSTHPRDDVALHLSPVFSSPPRLVRNSIINQQWGPEENYGPYFPFVAGQGFEIVILVDPNQFKIAVNGQHFTEFEHRLPIHTISHITIDGEVNISLIKFEIGGSPFQGSQQSSGGVGMPALPIGFIDPGSISPSRAPDYGPPGMSMPSQQSYAPPPSSPGYGPPGSAPYGPQAGSYPPQQQPGGYSGSYPPHQQPGGYPAAYSGSYPPQQPGAYPQGATVQYPGHEKKSGGLGGLGTSAAAIAGGLGAALLGGKAAKHGMGGIGGGGPASLLTGNIGSMLGGHGGKHGHKSSKGGIPMGGAIAGGATALAGAYMLSKSPIGKIMKPKKMKYKHKGGFHHGFGRSSSSSSSSEEE